jgi:uncharacterized LabA/DUF88 family protein
MSPASNKIALFIDGANLYATAKTLGFDIDYKRLLKEFQSRGTLVRAFYYTAIIEDQEYSSIRPLIDWLDYNGYTVVTKATKEFIDASGRRKVKGNMDIELAVDAMELAEHVDQIVLFSGDGDFRSLVEAVQRRGVRVTVVSTISSQPPMIADELRRQADVFTDLVELQSKLGRDPAERPAPREPRHHAPQFLQRATTMASRADDDDFYVRLREVFETTGGTAPKSAAGVPGFPSVSPRLSVFGLARYVGITRPHLSRSLKCHGECCFQDGDIHAVATAIRARRPPYCETFLNFFRLSVFDLPRRAIWTGTHMRTVGTLITVAAIVASTSVFAADYPYEPPTPSVPRTLYRPYVPPVYYLPSPPQYVQDLRTGAPGHWVQLQPTLFERIFGEPRNGY